jgi:diguanylate cyclase
VSVDEHVDLDVLNKELDNLFVIINQSGYKHSSVQSDEFYIHLKYSLDKLGNDSTRCEYISRLQSLVDSKVPNAEMSLQILACINDFSEEKIKQSSCVATFIESVTDGTEFEFEKKNLDTSKILQDLAVDLVEYIYKVKNDNKIGIGELAANADDLTVNINHMLLELVNQLTLPNEAKTDQFSLAKLLNRADNSKETWANAIQKIILLINRSIGNMQREKQELQTYLTKINMQLADIESYIHVLRKDSEESESRSLTLTESVELGISSIENTVEHSTDLLELKKDVSEKLNDIKKYVETYKHESDEKEHISAQSYAQIINELVHSQKESNSLKEQLEESKIQLLRDPLTGVPNRLAYEERVAVEVHRWKRHKSPLCLAMWDIDHFKKVNDNYGHGVGDRVLKLFSEIIQSRIRKVDLFARIGGEEFVLVMPDTELATALTLNDKLRKQLEDCNFHYDGHHCPISASVGIAEFIEGDEAESVMEKADEALYKSKNNGRNRCTIFEE